jgi:AcrR family transcriptional regulator
MHPPVTSDARDGLAPLDPRVARSRAKVIDAATQLLIEAGPRAVTVDAVVERSGVAKSTLYRHWTSREDLLVEVMRCNVPDLPPPAADLPFEAALRQFVHDLAAVLSSPDWRAIMPALIMLQQHMPELAHIAHDDRTEKFDILGGVLQRGVDEGVLPAGLDHELVARVLIGPMFFAVVSGHPDDADAVDATADFVVDRFLASYR